MAGSQLKNLKETLKSHGLIGQTNVPKKNKKSGRKNTSSKYSDREKKLETLQKIRDEFNPFEIKSIKTDKSKSNISNNHSKQLAKPGISKQIGEDYRLKNFNLKKNFKNKKGGIVDKRFGENDSSLSNEEKMLNRFVKERQLQSNNNKSNSLGRKNKKNLFNLNDEDDDDNVDMFAEDLTHGGKTLSSMFDNDDLNSNDIFDEGDLGVKRTYNDDLEVDNSNLPQRKKTKAEVMKEVIAKSKFYKQQRQKEHAKLLDNIDSLDDNFHDIMSELHSMDNKSTKSKDNTVTKADDDFNYDVKVKELLLEKRSVPSERTKTEEELQKEREDKMKELEQQRINRMNGMLEFEDEDDDENQEKGVEDLDGDFWDGDQQEDYLYGEEPDIADSDDDVKIDNDDENGSDNEEVTTRFPKKKSEIPCPQSHDELLSFLKTSQMEKHPALIKKVISSYQPKLAEGNKEKLATFSTVLLEHIIFLSNEISSLSTDEISILETVQNSLIQILKKLSEKYSKQLSLVSRDMLQDIQLRFKTDNIQNIKIGDLILLALLGSIFSTSDQYHVVITPCLIMIAEFLEQMKLNSYEMIAYGIILVKISIIYQKQSKRYIPEVVYFLKKALTTLISDNTTFRTRLDSYDLGITNDELLKGKIIFSNDEKQYSTIHLHHIFSKENSEISFKFTLINTSLETLDTLISKIWRDLSSFNEVIKPFKDLLDGYTTRYPDYTLPQTVNNKVDKLISNSEHYPLILQNFRKIGIPSRAPKFEDNFNPGKKSYDFDPTRAEVNKLKAQIKKERKFTLKEIRKDTRFEARQKIETKKQENEAYHKKMAHIMNKINTEEGAEKNKYEREKSLRSSKK